MKKVTLLLCVLSLTSNLFSQNSTLNNSVDSKDNFVVLSLGTKYSKIQIEEAFSVLDWCGYYFESSRHQIKLDDGSVLQFKSATELDNISEDCVTESFEDAKVYSIHSTNRIIIRVDKDASLKTFSTKQ